MNKFSFVMPMVINHRTMEDDDLERIIKIQLPTFDKYLDLNSLDKIKTTIGIGEMLECNVLKYY